MNYAAVSDLNSVGFPIPKWPRYRQGMLIVLGDGPAPTARHKGIEDQTVLKEKFARQAARSPITAGSVIVRQHVLGAPK
ncbi:hypothetical protein [Solirhodobacter olei]|uniref:hypothetical protein n=1 Tax=Solirhodobacter olei TaxID=2493082 RepID=UPI000FDC92EE|nr:hypothetical protein [Solirhodobacter olei]